MSKQTTSLPEGVRGWLSADTKASSSGAPSVKSHSSSGKSKEKRPRRNYSPPAMFHAPPQKKKTPSTPTKARSIKSTAPSVRSGNSHDTFDSTRTARLDDPFQSRYQPPPPPLPSKAKDFRGASKSALDLRAPVREAETGLLPTSASDAEYRTGLRLPALGRRRSAPLHAPGLTSRVEPLPPVRPAADHASVRGDSFRSAPRVYPSTTDHVPMPAQIVVPSAATQPDYVLGIIGSKACGKSTLIKNAINSADAEQSRIVAASADGPTMTLVSTTFSRGAVRILEINAEELLDLSDIESEKWRLWPDGFPKLNGVAVCYDAHDERSFNQAKQVLAGVGPSFTDPSFITLLIACKSDLLDDSAAQLAADRAARLGHEHNAKFVRVTDQTSEGAQHMIGALQWMLDHVAKVRGIKRVIIIPRAKKVSTAKDTPKSSLARVRSVGDLVSASPSETSDAGTRAAPPPLPPVVAEEPVRESVGEEQPPMIPPPLPVPASEPSELVAQQVPTPKQSEEIPQPRAPPLQLKIDGTPSEAPARKQPAPMSMRWATSDELLDKLFFAGVSDDEPSFIFNFFLTYRLFTTPRAVLLAFQKRLRELDDVTSDPLLAGFVQQRLCELLQLWMEDYPNDFAAPGAPSALAAIVRTACESTHLMYYGSEFTYFLDELPLLTDDASSWAFISPDTPPEDAESLFDFDLDFNHDFSFGADSNGLFADGHGLFDPAYTLAGAVMDEPLSGAEDQTRSAPLGPTDLGGRRMTRNESLQDETLPREINPDTRRNGSLLKPLTNIAAQVLEWDPVEIAEEITRIEAQLFLKIKPRDWVRRGVKEDKLGKPQSIVEMNAFFDHVGKWVMSIVVSLNRAHERAKLVTHLCDVAQALRGLNNYSSLRAFHVGINCVCETGDVVQSQVPDKTWRKYQSADKLLRVNENHLMYRMAVKNTFGAGIPSLEIHSSDLSRIGEMPNTNSDGQIHWAKLTHLGNNIHEINGFQERIREDGDYLFERRPALTRLIMEPELLDMDTIYDRCSQADRDLQHGYPVPIQNSTAHKLREYLRR